MSHQFTSGCFAFNNPAWHGLGTVIPHTLPATEMFRKADALFPVETLQLWAGDALSDSLIDAIAQTFNPQDASLQPALQALQRRSAIKQAISDHLLSMDESRIGIWRPDTRTILGTAGPDYKVIPNQRLLDFANAIREEVDMDTVIVLRGGAKVAFTAKIRGTDQQVVPGDKVYRNIVGYLGHDGATAFGGLYSDVRVVCSNTLGLAMRDANRHGRQFALRHTDSGIGQIDHVLANIDVARQSFPQVVEQYRAMRELPMSLDFYRHWLEQVYQVPPVRLDSGDTRPGRIDDLPRKWAALEQAWHHGLGSDIPGVAGTLYAGLNAVTEVESSQRTKGAGKRRLHSSLFGSGAAVIRRANALAHDLITA